MSESEQEYQKLFRKMLVPRFIVEAHPDDVFTIANVNNLALEYFGQTLEEIQGKKIEECVDQDNAQQFQQSFEVCRNKRRAVSIQALPGVPDELRIRGFYITPIFSEDGELDYLDVMGQMDIADKSILQRERDDAVSLLTSIFDVSEVGIIVSDHDQKIVRVNENFIRTFGWQRQELVDENIVDFITPDEREERQAQYASFIQTGDRASGEMKIIRKDGGVANTLYTTATLELSQNRRFQITTVMDITLRKQMEQSLRVAKDQADAANRSKSVFLANMSHELRTPLNAIIGFSEMMIEKTYGPLGNEKYGEYTGDIHSSANHLLEIINEVLDMSKIEAGRIELDEEDISVGDIIEAVVRMLDSKAFDRNVTLKVELDESLPHLYADGRLVRQILINLVSNAVKFSADGGDVIVSANILDTGDLNIRVVDQGVGIPQNKIKEALEPFGQVSDRADNAKYQGTGLGLPLAKAMVELHDGRLDLRSEEGRGTTIDVMFPVRRVLQSSAHKA